MDEVRVLVFALFPPSSLCNGVSAMPLAFTVVSEGTAVVSVFRASSAAVHVRM